MYQGQRYPINSFKGGYCGNLPITQLGVNQASDLDNIVLLPNGNGFRTRLGNSKVNTDALNSGAPIQGLNYYLQADADDWLVAVAGTQVLQSAAIDNSWTDITGALTITAGADNQWDLLNFQDVLLAFGGPPIAPDAPFKWTGTGDATALGGTSPSAYGALSVNNRVFAFRTTADPSTIFWSIIGDATDFAGTGSGSQTAGSLSDNQKITAAKMLSTNYMLVFKENSTYQMVVSSAPFPIYTLFEDTGCVGKNAVVNIDGIVYFITSNGEMKATDGESLKHFPGNADDLWDGVQTSRYPYINGFRQKGKDYDWLVWMVSTTGTTNNKAIIWDLINQCWLHCSTGYKFNISALDNVGLVYAGDYSGFIYKLDQSGVYADASETSPGTITSFWQSGWLNPTSMQEITQVRKLSVDYKVKASGSLTVYYGYDFITPTTNFSLSQVASSTEQYLIKSNMLTGRGNAFQYKIQQSSSTIDSEVHSITLSGKTYGQKELGND